MKHESPQKAMSAASASVSRKRTQKEEYKRKNAILLLFQKQTAIVNKMFGHVLKMLEEPDDSDSPSEESYEHESIEDSQESKTPRF